MFWIQQSAINIQGHDIYGIKVGQSFISRRISIGVYISFKNTYTKSIEQVGKVIMHLKNETLHEVALYRSRKPILHL